MRTATSVDGWSAKEVVFSVLEKGVSPVMKVRYMHDWMASKGSTQAGQPANDHPSGMGGLQRTAPTSWAGGASLPHRL